MKQITNKTILKQGDKTYQPIGIDGVIYWVGTVRHMTEYVTNGTEIFKPSDLPEYSVEYAKRYWQKIVTQSESKLDGIPVVSLDSYLDLRFKNETTTWSWGESGPRTPKEFYKMGFKSNPNKYTQADIEKAYKLGYEDRDSDIGFGSNLNYAIEQSNSISVIEVDEKFNVISYDN